MNTPLISCIVPVFNGERFLGAALDSILRQTYEPIEVIVVDDGSNDGTPDVAARYGRSIRYVRQDNRGSASAKNRGLAEARGEVLAFLDADDIWHENKLARQYCTIAERPVTELYLSFTSFQNFWMPELADEAERFRDDPIAGPCTAWSIGTLLTRRMVFEKLGGFADGRRGNENLPWFFAAARAGATIGMLPEVLMYRRFHQDNDGRGTSEHARDLFLPIVRAWRDFRRFSEGQNT